MKKNICNAGIILKLRLVPVYLQPYLSSKSEESGKDPANIFKNNRNSHPLNEKFFHQNQVQR